MLCRHFPPVLLCCDTGPARPAAKRASDQATKPRWMGEREGGGEGERETAGLAPSVLVAHTRTAHDDVAEPPTSCVACSSLLVNLLGGEIGVTCNGRRKAPPDPSGTRNVSGAAATRRRQIRASRKPLPLLPPRVPKKRAPSLPRPEPPTRHTSGYLRRLALSPPTTRRPRRLLPPMTAMTVARDTAGLPATMRLDVDVDLPPLLVVAPG